MWQLRNDCHFLLTCLTVDLVACPIPNRSTRTYRLIILLALIFFIGSLPSLLVPSCKVPKLVLDNQDRIIMTKSMPVSKLSLIRIARLHVLLMFPVFILLDKMITALHVVICRLKHSCVIIKEHPNFIFRRVSAFRNVIQFRIQLESTDFPIHK